MTILQEAKMSPGLITQKPLHVAIIGGGITGLTLAIGLQSRNVSFTVYERATSFREVGAGIGLSANAERAMTALDSTVRAAYENVAMPNGEDYFQFVDGFKTDEIIFKLPVGKDGFRGCRRSDFLEELFKLLPDEAVQWGKAVETIEEDHTTEGPVTLTFKDGSVAQADVGETKPYRSQLITQGRC